MVSQRRGWAPTHTKNSEHCGTDADVDAVDEPVYTDEEGRHTGKEEHLRGRQEGRRTSDPSRTEQRSARQSGELDSTHIHTLTLGHIFHRTVCCEYEAAWSNQRCGSLTAQQIMTNAASSACTCGLNLDGVTHLEVHAQAGGIVRVDVDVVPSALRVALSAVKHRRSCVEREGAA